VRCSKTKGGDFVGRDEDFDGGFDCHQGAMRLLTVLQEDFARKTSAEDLQEVWRDLPSKIADTCAPFTSTDSDYTNTDADLVSIKQRDSPLITARRQWQCWPQ